MVPARSLQCINEFARRKKNLKEVSIDAEAGREADAGGKSPSPTLRALAQKAIDGDW